MHIHHHLMRLARRFLPLLFFLATSVPRIWSAQLVWTNPAGGNWTNAANWDLNTVPALADTAVITNAGNYTVTISSAVSAANVLMGYADTNVTGIRTLNVTAG